MQDIEANAPGFKISFYMMTNKGRYYVLFYVPYIHGSLIELSSESELKENKWKWCMFLEWGTYNLLI